MFVGFRLNSWVVFVKQGAVKGGDSREKRYKVNKPCINVGNKAWAISSAS
jgi:hypothetical protein